MEIVYVVLAMIVVGFIVGYVAGLIWKDDFNNYPTAIIAAIITGLLDYYIIPMMGLESLKWVGVALEPPLVALGVLWLIRYSKRND